MPKKNRNKGFPHIVSLPSIKIDCVDDEEIPLSDLTATTGPNVRGLRIGGARNWSPISISSDEDEDELRDVVPKDLQDFELPIIMKKQPSMLSLRSRRDPKYQGIRSIKPVRVIHKSGGRNINGINLPEKSIKFTKDLVNTLVDAQWRYVLLFFAFAFFGSWLFFAIFYFIIAWSHGDLEFESETGQRLGEDSQPCINEAQTFTAFFLFSIESQVSTGFGTFYPTEICPEAIFVLIVQLICGLVIDAAVVGIFYVKIIRPPKYSLFKFSRKAVICQRDTRLCLLFRVADFQQTHAIDTQISAYLFEEKISFEGERMGKTQESLKLENNGRVFLIWPLTVCHFIDKSSPFYDLSAKDLLERRFEVIVSMTGVSRNTGQMTQARTSYLSREILWGYRFTNIVNYNEELESYVTDTEKLDELEQVDTALCSAQRLEEILHEVNYILEKDTTASSCAFVNQLPTDYDYEEDDDSSSNDDDRGIHMLYKSPADMTTRR